MIFYQRDNVTKNSHFSFFVKLSLVSCIVFLQTPNVAYCDENKVFGDDAMNKSRQESENTIEQLLLTNTKTNESGSEDAASASKTPSSYSVETKYADLEPEARKKTKDQKSAGIVNRILPFMVVPFVVATAIIPMSLVALKFMLLQSFVIGKIAIALLLVNMFRRRTNQGGVFNHDVVGAPDPHQRPQHQNYNSREEYNSMPQDMSMAHYGYNGGEEYGAYVNGKRRKRAVDVR